MSQATVKRIHLICGIVISLLLVAVGICFIASCIAIYHSGDRPFSRESVSAAFSKIAIPVYLCIAAVIGGGILQWALPLEERGLKGSISPDLTLQRLTARLELSTCSEETLRAISLQRRLRRICRVVVGVLCSVCALFVVVYLLTPANFTMDTMNADVFSAMLLTVCFFAGGAVLCIAGGILNGISIRCETALVKQAIAAGAVKQNEKNADGEEKKKRRILSGRGLLITRIAIVAVAVVFIVIGILNGGMADVFAKAVRICTECIGLG